MPAVEFVSYLKYLKEKYRREEIEIRRQQAKYKRH